MFFRLWFFIVHFAVVTRCNYTILSIRTNMSAYIYLCVCNYIYVYASVPTYIYLRVRVYRIRTCVCIYI